MDDQLPQYFLDTICVTIFIMQNLRLIFICEYLTVYVVLHWRSGCSKCGQSLANLTCHFSRRFFIFFDKNIHNNVP